MPSVYEAIHVFGIKIWNLESHLERLRKSAEFHEIEIHKTNDEIRENLENLAKENNFKESYFLIIVSNTTFEITQTPYSRIADSGKVITFKGERPAPKAKTWDLEILIKARTAAKEAGAIDALYVTEENNVPEAATSNVFIVLNGTLVTPTSHALSGTTQQYVLKLAEELEISTEIRDIKLNEIFESNELFITSALKLIMPITHVDQRAVNNGTIGPVTKTLVDALNQKIDEHNRS